MPQSFRLDRTQGSDEDFSRVFGRNIDPNKQYTSAERNSLIEESAASAETQAGRGVQFGFSPVAGGATTPAVAGAEQVAPVVEGRKTASNNFGAGGSPEISERDRIATDLFNESQVSTDPEQIRKDTLKRFQAEIDATNAIYDDMLGKARVEGTGRLGSQRAISARSGTLGSDFGAANKDKVLGYNRDIESGIQAQRAAKISAIMTGAEDRASAEIAKKNEARRGGAKDYLAYLEGSADRKRTNATAVMQSLIAQGIDVEDLDEGQLSTLANNLEMSNSDLANIYKGELTVAAQAQEAEQADMQREQQADAKKFALDYQITSPFYTITGGDIYNSATGKSYASVEEFQADNPGVDPATVDVQQVKAKADKPTSNIQEYNFYAEQEREAGREPMGFNDYQTADANRKKSTARGSAPKAARNDLGETDEQQNKAELEINSEAQVLARGIETREDWNDAWNTLWDTHSGYLQTIYPDQDINFMIDEMLGGGAFRDTLQ